ncbi:hypothetical protein E4U53_000860 [Claviceps sorghi]|nr:hypothetical protein E4U53_000860 [Claviceps sorghi]
MRLLAVLLAVQGAYAATVYCDNKLYGTTCGSSYDGYCCETVRSNIFPHPKEAHGVGFTRSGKSSCEGAGIVMCVT